jgi:NAD(P)H dehydrogenase (quinone)
MRILMIYAHPNPNSFCHAILETLQEVCNRFTVPFAVRDLYALNFDPVLRSEALDGGKNREVGEEVRFEQDLIRHADWIYMVFPLWWSGMPAILKGYVDRVLTYGFAFEDTPQGITGLLQGKKVLLFTTTGTSGKELMSQGIPQAFQIQLTKGMLDFCGMETAGHFFFYGIPATEAPERAKMLEEITQTIQEQLKKRQGTGASPENISPPLTLVLP